MKLPMILIKAPLLHCPPFELAGDNATIMALLSDIPVIIANSYFYL